MELLVLLRIQKTNKQILKFKKPTPIKGRSIRRAETENQKKGGKSEVSQIELKFCTQVELLMKYCLVLLASLNSLYLLRYVDSWKTENP